VRIGRPRGLMTDRPDISDPRPAEGYAVIDEGSYDLYTSRPLRAHRHRVGRVGWSELSFTLRLGIVCPGAER
jgi:hypothetical protein